MLWAGGASFKERKVWAWRRQQLVRGSSSLDQTQGLQVTKVHIPTRFEPGCTVAGLSESIYSILNVMQRHERVGGNPGLLDKPSQGGSSFPRLPLRASCSMPLCQPVYLEFLEVVFVWSVLSWRFMVISPDPAALVCVLAKPLSGPLVGY